MIEHAYKSAFFVYYVSIKLFSSLIWHTHSHIVIFSAHDFFVTYIAQRITGYFALNYRL
jgi:hypothetical protein